MNKQGYIDINSILYKFILLSPIAMLFQNLIPFINQLIIGGIILCLIIQVIMRITKDSVILLFVSGIPYIVTLFQINKYFMETNMLFYYPLWILFFIYMRDYDKEFVMSLNKNIKFTKITITIWCVLVFISFYVPNCYTISADGYLQFQSFSNGPFRFAPTTIFEIILIYLIYFYTKNKFYIFLCLVPLIGACLTSSRTYAFIAIIIYLYYFYSSFNKKYIFMIISIPIIIFCIINIENFTFMQKIFTLSNKVNIGNQDFLAIFTSGRSKFWNIDINEFLNYGIIQKLFGKGLTYTREINYKNYGLIMWAHNDYIELLVCHGIIGIFSYLYVFFSYLKKCIKKYGKLTYIEKIVIILTVGFNSFFNGVYTYVTVTLCIPFLYYSMYLMKNTNISNNKILK